MSFNRDKITQNCEVAFIFLCFRKNICRNIVAGFHCHVIKELAELKASISEISAQIYNIQTTLNALTPKHAAASSYSFKLPLNSILEMDELEESFEEENIKSAMVCIKSFTYLKFLKLWITCIFDGCMLFKIL